MCELTKEHFGIIVLSLWVAHSIYLKWPADPIPSLGMAQSNWPTPGPPASRGWRRGEP